mmetsp:Transcript_22782/g.44763  ORF Transcript_22782/g.44763 Transcript_22782/m.44763 type:complete len:912 (+) Transcript_22782:34-2769(+)
MASVRLTRGQHYCDGNSKGVLPPGSNYSIAGTAKAAISVLLRWAGAGAVVACAGVVVVVLTRRRAKRHAEKRKLLSPQTERIENPERQSWTPGQGAPLLHGVRVLELSTDLAAPYVGRIFAELGAEVIKVETLEGDQSRKTHLDFEQEPRAYGTNFEISNLGKSSFCVDLDTPAGVEQVKQLLRETDVFITNLRPGKLERLTLDPSSVLHAFPHVIFAQLTAWGLHGAGRNMAGYDIGSFWAATGFSTLMHHQHNIYEATPFGMGDATASQALLTGIAIALVQRAETGRGQFLDSSLLHAGAWCVGPYAAVGGLERMRDLSSNPLRHIYRTGDGVQIAICGHRQRNSDRLGRVRSGEQAFSNALALDGPPSRGSVDLLSAAERRIASMTASQVCDLLAKHEIAFQRVRDFTEIWSWVAEEGGQSAFSSLPSTLSPSLTSEEQLWRPPSPSGVLDSLQERDAFKQCLQHTSDEVRDLRFSVRMPYEFSCSQHHTFDKARAPEKGAHTRDILSRGWLPRNSSALLPKASAAFIGNLPPPLAGCVVLELVDFDAPEPSICVSAACRILLERGATVLRIEPRSGDPMKTEDPGLYELYNAGKEVIHVGSLSMEGNAVLQRLLETRASVFVSNFAQSRLKLLDLDAKSLAERCPKVLVVNLCECRGRSTDVGTTGALFAATGLAHLFIGSAPTTTNVPPQHCFDLLASLYLSSAITLGYFHLKRTSEGQFVRVFLDNIAIWSSQNIASLVHKDLRMGPMLVLKAADFCTGYALPCSRPIQLKDGTWIQLMGVDTMLHLPRTLQALRIPLHTGWSKIIWCFLYDVLPNKTATNSMERSRPLLGILNTMFQDAASKLDSKTFHERAAQVDLWYTAINPPEYLPRHPQSRQNTIFEATEHGHNLRVSSPFSLQSQRVAL